MSDFLVLLVDASSHTEQGRVELRSKLASEFGMSEDALETIFSSLPMVLKRGITKAQAEHFAGVLQDLGAEVEVTTNEQIPKKTPKQQTTVEEEDNNELEFQLELNDESKAPEVKRSPEVTKSIKTKEGEPKDTSPKEPVLASKTILPPKEASLSIELEESPTTEKTPPPSPEPEIPEPSVTSPPKDLETETPFVDPLSDSFAQAQFTSSAFESVSSTLSPSPEQTAPMDLPEVTMTKSQAKNSKLPIFAGATALVIIAIVVINGLSVEEEEKIVLPILKTEPADLLAKQDAITGEAVETPEPTTKLPKTFSGVLLGEDVKDGNTVSLELKVTNEKLTNIQFNLTTEEPPPLTPEEIVEGKKPPLWLKRFEVENRLTPNEITTEGELIKLQLPGKAYLKQKNDSKRVIADLILSGTIKAPRKFTWEVKHGDIAQPGTQESTTGKVNIFYRGSLLLKEK